MKLYLCEKRRDADAIAAVLGFCCLGVHAYIEDERCIAWFLGDPNVSVEIHTAQPIAPQLLGLKELLNQADEVVIVDTGSSSRRDAAIVLDLLGYRGAVTTFVVHASTLERNGEYESLRLVAKEINALIAADQIKASAVRKHRREVLNNAFRTLFQAGWQITTASELNAIHVHVLLMHWEQLVLSQQEISRRLDQIMWLADRAALRHVATLGNCVQCIMHDRSLPGRASYAQIWLLCAQAFDVTWLAREPSELALSLVPKVVALEQEKCLGH